MILQGFACLPSKWIIWRICVARDFPKWPPMSSKEGRLMKQPHHLKVIKVACAYLQAAANPDDDNAMKVI